MVVKNVDIYVTYHGQLYSVVHNLQYHFESIVEPQIHLPCSHDVSMSLLNLRAFQMHIVCI